MKYIVVDMRNLERCFCIDRIPRYIKKLAKQGYFTIIRLKDLKQLVNGKWVDMEVYDFKLGL